MRSSYADLVGQEHAVAVVCEVRDRVATALRQAGYIAAVEVPEQRIADGTVRFKVLMAKLVQVRVRGDAGGAEQTIAGYLNRLTEQPVFNRRDAERYLLLASDLPGYNVRLTLRPAGTVPGEVIGDVTVLHTAAFVDTIIQNYGSKDLGRWGGLIRGQLYGLTGLGDRTTASFFTTSDFEEQQTLQLGHDFRIGGEGLTASGNFTYAWARPDTDDGTDIDARTLFATAEVGYPFVRRQAHTVRGSRGPRFHRSGCRARRSQTDARPPPRGLRALDRRRGQHGFLATPDRRCMSRFGGSADCSSCGRASTFSGRPTPCGLGGGNCLVAGNVPPSRIEADGTATVFRGSAYGEYRPVSGVTVALGTRFQVAGQPLLSFEEFSAGNYTVGRGYDAGTLLGDSGIGFQAELRGGSLIATSASKPAAEGYLFFDYAKISNEDELFTFDGPRDLSSAGIGVRANLDRFRLDVALAFPLQRAGFLNEKPDPRLLFSLTTRLWPWSY